MFSLFILVSTYWRYSFSWLLFPFSFGDIKNFHFESLNLNCSNIKDFDKTSSHPILALKILKIKNTQRITIANSFSIRTSFFQDNFHIYFIKIKKKFKNNPSHLLCAKWFKLIWYLIFSVLTKMAFFIATNSAFYQKE